MNKLKRDLLRMFLWGQPTSGPDVIYPASPHANVFVLKSIAEGYTGAQKLTSFAGSSLDHVYAATGVDLERWKEWERERKSGIPSPLSPEYPELSKLAWWFVDPVFYTRSEVHELRNELVRLGAAFPSETSSFTSTLLPAVEEAIRCDLPIGVYP